MKILTFSRFFPKGHIREGQPTFFVEQIWKGFYQDGKCPEFVNKWIKEYTAHIPDIGSYNDAGIKGHTIRSELLEDIYRAIDRLPGQRKEVLLLFYREGLDVEEVGERLGYNKDTVRSLRSKALKQLKGLLIIK